MKLISFENCDCRYNYSDLFYRRTFGNELYDLELQNVGDSSHILTTKSKVSAEHPLA